MTAVALNNLWTYIEGLSLKQKDREWLAGKLLEPKADDADVTLLTIYDKSEIENVSDEYIKWLISETGK